ncbi:hypothetical protein D8S78_06960 [Natrialba swarupiae]|nr:hypothetical protein [Natrialba swarupiae]
MTRPLEVDRPETSTPGSSQVRRSRQDSPGRTSTSLRRCSKTFGTVTRRRPTRWNPVRSPYCAESKTSTRTSPRNRSRTQAGIQRQRGPRAQRRRQPDSTDDAGLESPSEDEPGDRR